MQTKTIDSWVDLSQLIEATRHIRMTPEQEAEQRRSFVFGNVHLSNEAVTRAMVAEADAQLQAEREAPRG